jgi:hypothetical protein
MYTSIAEAFVPLDPRRIHRVLEHEQQIIGKQLDSLFQKMILAMPPIVSASAVPQTEVDEIADRRHTKHASQ